MTKNVPVSGDDNDIKMLNSYITQLKQVINKMQIEQNKMNKRIDHLRNENDQLRRDILVINEIMKRF